MAQLIDIETKNAFQKGSMARILKHAWGFNHHAVRDKEFKDEINDDK